MGLSNTAEDALLQHEAGQTLFDWEAFSDDGDQINFSGSASLFSGKAGFTPDVKPDGLSTGGVVIPEVGATNDQVDVAALTLYQSGVLQSVGAAAGTAITRAATADWYIVNSITVNSSQAIAVVTGTQGASKSSTRAAAGGPPLIPVGSTEVAQIVTQGSVAAPITADEIFQVPGQHTERYDFPVWKEDMANGKVVFTAALPNSHVGVIPKAVYVKSYEPIFIDVPLASDFVPPEVTHSVGSNQVYQQVIGSTSKALAAGTFNVFLQDGITDAIVKEKDENIWFKFFPDLNKAPHILALGKLGMSRSFPAGDSIQSACTISSSEEATENAT